MTSYGHWNCPRLQIKCYSKQFPSYCKIFGNRTLRVVATAIGLKKARSKLYTAYNLTFNSRATAILLRQI